MFFKLIAELVSYIAGVKIIVLWQDGKDFNQVSLSTRALKARMVSYCFIQCLTAFTS